MSWFLSKICDRFMEAAEEACLRDWRRELLTEARGEVLEVGAGTGMNLPLYPEAVDRLVVVEPDPHMRGELAQRIGEQPGAGVELVDAGAEVLPFEEETFDTVVTTLVICSVGDVRASLEEMRRVLKPGGRLLFLEHVAAHDNPGRLKWQERIEPVWRRVADGCHLTRRTAEEIEAAGFEIEELIRESMQKAFPIVRPTVRGIACKPG
jgi:ubiquinone/menaquinone biosynthesis C-methylase UbiE